MKFCSTCTRLHWIKSIMFIATYIKKTSLKMLYASRSGNAQVLLILRSINGFHQMVFFFTLSIRRITILNNMYLIFLPPPPISLVQIWVWAHSIKTDLFNNTFIYNYINSILLEIIMAQNCLYTRRSIYTEHVFISRCTFQGLNLLQTP